MDENKCEKLTGAENGGKSVKTVEFMNGEKYNQLVNKALAVW